MRLHYIPQMLILKCLAILLIAGLIGCGADADKISIVDFSPQDETSRQTNVTVRLSADVVTSEEVAKIIDAAHLSFEPPLEGRSKWIDQRTLRFYPTEELHPSTDYKAMVLPSITGDMQLQLEGQREFSFHTVYLKVLNASQHPSFDPVDETLRFSVYLEFNESVDPVELVKYAGLKLLESSVNLKFDAISQISSLHHTLRSDPVTIKTEKEKLQIVVRSGLMCDGSNHPLEKDFSQISVLETRQELLVKRVWAVSTGINRYDIRIRFSDPVASSEAREFIEISPAANLTWSESGRDIIAAGTFEPGTLLEVKISEGLASKGGARFRGPFSQSVSLGNLKPGLRFTSPGKYLSRSGLKNVEIEVINLNKVHIEVEKLYRNNLVYHLLENRNRHSRGKKMSHLIHSEDIDLTIEQNSPAVITVNFEEFLRNYSTGLFYITIRRPERYWSYDQKTIMLTDIGLIAKLTGSELNVWSMSVGKLEPTPGVEVSLISSSNQQIANGKTGNDGRITFSNLEQVKDEQRPYVIIATSGDDFSYLLFDECEISTADFDVEGRPVLLEGHEAFIYTDRGVYRPGDTAHLAGIVRGKNLSTPEPFPLRLEIEDPRGSILFERQERNPAEGWVHFDIPIPKYALTGRYRAKLFGAGTNPCGSVEFMVEEFMPDRIRISLATDKPEYRPSETMALNVTGTMMFGPPAAGRKVEASYKIQPVEFVPPGWNSFSFGNRELKFEETGGAIGEGKLDNAGEAGFKLDIPPKLKPPSGLRCLIEATIHELGGRSVSASSAVPVHAYPAYVGIKRDREGYGDVNRSEEFSFITVNPDGSPQRVSSLKAAVKRIKWTSALRRDDRGNYRYHSQRTSDIIESITLSSDGSVGHFEFTPKEWGSYEVTVVDPASGAEGSVSFHVSGWGYSPWAMEQPEKIDIDFDKDVYRPGDAAKVLVKAPFSGTLLLTLEREKVLYSRVISMSGNTAEVQIPVSEEYRPNVYATATLIRSAESAEKHAPLRAYGTMPLVVDCSDHRLNVELDIPRNILPNSKLDVDVQVSPPGNIGNWAAESTWLTVAAVDEGILQLTAFETPDPMDLFFGKKQLNVNTYDIFSYFLPEAAKSNVHSSPAGDRGIRRSHLMPVSVQRVEPVALWSGLVKLDRKGRTKVTFDVPEFNGNLRLMAVAAGQDYFGSIDAGVTVANLIVLTPTFPRFLAPLDEFTVPVTVFNNTGKAAAIKVRVETEGPVMVVGKSETDVEMKPGEEKVVTNRFKVQKAIGKVRFRITAQGAGSFAERTVNIPVRPASPPVSLTGSGVIKPARPEVLMLPDEWIPGSAKYNLSLMPFPVVKFSSSLQYLLRYPYGCIEQTTSKAFPLLYFKDLAKTAEPELFAGNSSEYYVSQAIDRIAAMQTTSGGFGFWLYSNNINDWGSIYASHFLVEAQKAGFNVPGRVMKRCLDYLKKILLSSEPVHTRDQQYLYRTDPGYRLELKAYCAYVLALAGKPVKGTMHYLAEDQADKMSLRSNVLLAGAFAFSGDLNMAFKLLPTSFEPQSLKRETGGTFSSSVSTNAMILNVLCEVSPDHPAVAKLVAFLGEATENGRWQTTQDNVWALLALGKMLRKKSAGNYTGYMRVNGKEYAEISSTSQVFSDTSLGGKKIEMITSGDGECYYYWEARGIPVNQAFSEKDAGLKVRRQYFNANGVLMPREQIKTGQMVIAGIEIKANAQSVENVIIDDMLPAGLEIENSRLESRSSLQWLPEKTMEPDYVDIRDDRLLLFLDLQRNQEYKYYYALRAVISGTFTLPPVSAECMYDPELNSTSSSGIIKVIQ